MQKNDLDTTRPPILSCPSGFTLIELLIVIGLLGAIATLVLPGLTADREEVMEKQIAPTEMADICNAFAKFKADCAPTKGISTDTDDQDEELIGKYGLEILMTYESSRGWSFLGDFNPDRGKGWRGPYLERQGSREVDDTADGQPLKSGGTEIPVVHDPYHDSDGDKYYYRVLYESKNRYLALVYVGKDGELDCTIASGLSGGEDFNDAFDNHSKSSGTKKDDVIRALWL